MTKSQEERMNKLAKNWFKIKSKGPRSQIQCFKQGYRAAIQDAQILVEILEQALWDAQQGQYSTEHEQILNQWRSK